MTPLARALLSVSMLIVFLACNKSDDGTTTTSAKADTEQAPSPEAPTEGQSSDEPEQAQEQAELVGTNWRLVRLNEVPIPLQEIPPFVRFDLDEAKRKVTGFSGCNRFFGSYELEGSSLRFGHVGATRMACPDSIIEEQRFLTALTQTTSYQIRGNTLELLQDGKVVATFEASGPSEP